MLGNSTLYLNKLIEAAQQSSLNAYAPYSQFNVGAALLTQSNKIVSGCNVENASYGLTLCAERNCIANAINQGETQFTTLLIYTKQEKLTPPCGACRQVIVEFFNRDAIIIVVNHNHNQKNWSVAQLLPDAFTPENLSLSSRK